ncbi:MAG: hypothetical protein FJ291_29355 [Planctomycetes bacterium]|nr:hypothetical protein [Planctomycetota bacterium]
MKKRLRRLVLVVGAVLAVAGAAVSWRYGRAVWYPAYRGVGGRRTVEDVVREYGPAAEGRLRPHFERAGVAYPPARVALLAFKEEKRLELWVGKGSGWAFIRSYPILAASGKAGPKLRRGDRQVPEGFYRVEALNPNSSYHLSIKLDYPNADDLARAKEDGRTDLGGDIFIHGKGVSIGCIAVGDGAIEELFVLVALVGREQVGAIISPADFRIEGVRLDSSGIPRWVPALYDSIRQKLRQFRIGYAGEAP